MIHEALASVSMEHHMRSIILSIRTILSSIRVLCIAVVSPSRRTVHVLGELQFPDGFLNVDCGYFAEDCEFRLELVQNIRGHWYALPPLKLLKDLFEICKLAIRPCGRTL